MLINTDLSTESAGGGLQTKRVNTSASAATQSPDAAQIDPSLQRLTQTPLSVQDADWAIQDEQGASESVAAASRAMLNQSGLAFGAQANQLSQNVLSLLQSID